MTKRLQNKDKLLKSWSSNAVLWAEIKNKIAHHAKSNYYNQIVHQNESTGDMYGKYKYIYLFLILTFIEIILF